MRGGSFSFPFTNINKSKDLRFVAVNEHSGIRAIVASLQLKELYYSTTLNIISVRILKRAEYELNLFNKKMKTNKFKEINPIQINLNKTCFKNICDSRTLS